MSKPAGGRSQKAERIDCGKAMSPRQFGAGRCSCRSLPRPG